MSGGGMGGGIGATLGTLVAAALAPETGGTSLLVDAGLDAGTAALVSGAATGAVGGALGGGLGSAATGGSFMKGAEGGGASGLFGGVLSGLLSPADAASSQILDASGAASAASDAGSGATTGAGGAETMGALDASSTPTAGDSLAPSLSSSSPLSAADTNFLNGTTPAAADPQVIGPTAPSVNAPTPTGPNGGVQLPGTQPPSNSSSGNFLSNLLGGGSSSDSNTAAAGNVIGAATKTGSSGIGQYLLPAGLGLAAISALLPKGSNPVNTSNVTNAQNQQSTGLPSYNYNSVQTPYQGSWYTYGQRPETPMISNTVTPAARGGLIRGYADGGTVTPLPGHKPMPPPSLAFKPLSVQAIANALPKGVLNAPAGYQQPNMNPQQAPAALSGGTPAYGGYAMGGMVRSLAMGGLPMQAPMMPPQPMPQPPQGAPMPPQGGMPQRPNPLQAAAQFQIGQRIGKALRQHIKGTAPGMVRGPGTGQSDSIPAKLSSNEYIIPADTVAHLGDGSSDAGGKVLDHMVHKVREHKTSHKGKFPPRAKSPLAYARRA